MIDTRRFLETFAEPLTLHLSAFRHPSRDSIMLRGSVPSLSLSCLREVPAGARRDILEIVAGDALRELISHVAVAP